MNQKKPGKNIKKQRKPQSLPSTSLHVAGEKDIWIIQNSKWKEQNKKSYKNKTAKHRCK